MRIHIHIAFDEHTKVTNRKSNEREWHYMLFSYIIHLNKTNMLKNAFIFQLIRLSSIIIKITNNPFLFTQQVQNKNPSVIKCMQFFFVNIIFL